MKIIKPDEFNESMRKYMTDYVEDIEDEVISVTDSITKEAIQELKNVSLSKFGNSGRDEPYYRGWTSKISTRGHSKYLKVIWNKTNYQLTHLLEFGHYLRNGDRWEGRPHIADIEKKYSVKFVDLIEERIRRSGKK